MLKRLLIAGVLTFSAVNFVPTAEVQAQSTGQTHRRPELTEAQKEAIKELRAKYQRKVQALSDRINDLAARIRTLRNSSDPRNRQEIEAIRAEIRAIANEIIEEGRALAAEIRRISNMNTNRP